MKTGKTKILRVYLSNTDKFKNAPLYEVLVFAAKRSGVAGATVLKGIMGYGSSNVIGTGRFWEISEKIPLVAEFIDEPEVIDAFTEKITPWLEATGKGIIVTCTDSEVVFARRGQLK
jgi:hypothetical protein